MIKRVNKNILNVALVLIMFISLIAYMIIVDGWANIVVIINQIKPVWFIIAALLMITYWLLEAAVLHIVTKKVCTKRKFMGTLRVSMVGQLFNNLTPFASGGQPMQAVTMIRSGVSVTSSATILLIKFIIFQSVLVLYTSIIMIFKFAYFKELVSSFIALSVVGFTINLTVIIVLILVGTNKELVYGIIKPIYEYLDKIRILKNVDEKLVKLRKDMDIFHSEFRILRKEKLMIIKTFVLTLVQLTAFSSVTYAVYRAFGESLHSMFDIIAAQTFLMMIMAFIPIPGAGGAAEGGFYIIFRTFFAQNEIKMAILFWRLYTFYLPILVGVVFFIFKSKKSTKLVESIEEQAIKIDDNKTEMVI